MGFQERELGCAPCGEGAGEGRRVLGQGLMCGQTGGAWRGDVDRAWGVKGTWHRGMRGPSAGVLFAL